MLTVLLLEKPRHQKAGTLSSNFPVSKINSESLSPIVTPFVPAPGAVFRAALT